MLTKLKELINKHRQFLLYSIVGVANTLITWAAFYLLNKQLGMDEVYHPYWLMVWASSTASSGAPGLSSKRRGRWPT